MGNNAFEDDPDVQAMRASMRPAGGSTRWGRVLTGVLVVGCVTFALAYHLPLQRAHGLLGQRFSELSQQVGSATRAADEARKQVKELTEKQQALESQAEQAKQADKSRTDASQAVKGALETKLQKLLSKEQAAVGVAGTRAVASIAIGQVLTAGKVEVSAPGKATLCGVAGASKDGAIRVVAVADKKSIPAALLAKLKTPLQYSSAVAQAVTEALEKCGVAPARLSATGVPAEPSASVKVEGKKLAGARIELWLE
jgi:multidrug efflux pump subunit AcrA (membrane-fusion protein)